MPAAEVRPSNGSGGRTLPPPRATSVLHDGLAKLRCARLRGSLLPPVSTALLPEPAARDGSRAFLSATPLTCDGVAADSEDRTRSPLASAGRSVSHRRALAP